MFKIMSLDVGSKMFVRKSRESKRQDISFAERYGRLCERERTVTAKTKVKNMVGRNQ